MDDWTKSRKSFIKKIPKGKLKEIPEGRLVYFTNDGKIIADPCTLINEKDWSEFCDFLLEHSVGARRFFTWISLSYKGVPIEITHTGADGDYFGVAVDTGTLMSIDVENIAKINPAFVLSKENGKS